MSGTLENNEACFNANKLLEAQYRCQIESNNLQGDSELAVLFHIDTEEIETWGKYPEGMNDEVMPSNYTELIEKLNEFYVPRNKKKFLEKFSIESIRKVCYDGILSHSWEYECVINDSKSLYFRGTHKFGVNPATNSVMCIFNIYNITEQKYEEDAIDFITKYYFELITVLDIKSKKFIKVINDSESRERSLVDTCYEDYTSDIVSKLVIPDEREFCLNEMELSAILDGLEESEIYICSFTIINKRTKKKERKRWKFLYLDDTRTELLVIQRDITEIFEKDKIHTAELKTALAAAQQANVAKTEFLSRMSHEIRTPMNAIIGMTTIAAQSIENTEQVEECISKIGISSRFLLSLINDILDMSRIESGKMMLQSEKIQMDDFFNGINSICYTQACAKSIEYECIISSIIDDCYIGDSMKLQQILLNVISNGIKYTEPGGRVTLAVWQREKRKNSAILRFVINDTGIGMEDEFIDKMYDPFAQENSSITSVYGGTGLGLSIAKNLVDMMNGQIIVRSIKGVGTEFTIDLELGVTEDIDLKYKRPEYIFTDLRTLVVDDDVLVCESAMVILGDMGVNAEWVDSGIKAVERVRDMWNAQNYYDMILIDWKMPEMDGVETARRIREIVGDEVTIIIITAYDWIAIEQEAKSVGVNMLISKPMLKSTLVSAFSKVMGEKDEKDAGKVLDEHDFTGRRVLLVEDHPINVEVACILLKQKGFIIETADNGLRAIEMFTGKEKGYYDVILMDIRMPVMDGLQATKNIRHMQNPDAKTIPIIAMTANAFEEDVNKSRMAGMNAHLAKPIDAEQLFKTLYNLIET